MMNGFVASVRATGVQLQGAGHQREMAERLGGVAEQPAGGRIPFLAEQSDVVAQRQQPFEQLCGSRLLAGQVQGVDQPERARNEQAFPAG
jgi:hypothetical protein